MSNKKSVDTTADPSDKATSKTGKTTDKTATFGPVLSGNSESFRLLIESVKDYAIFLLDWQGYVVTWNPGAERIKGYSAKEIIDKHFSTFYTEEAKLKKHPQYELEVAQQEGRYEEEGWRVRKDGTTFWANVVITALFDEGGALQGFAKVTRDMTDRKMMEEDLRNSRDRLEQRVQERTAELTTANQILRAEVQRRQQLEESLRLQTDRLKNEAQYKDEFLAMLAHELRNPMGALSNALHILLLGEPGSAAFERAKDVALRQLAHQTRLVDDLLDVSRMIRKKIELKHEAIDLIQVVKDSVDDHRASLERAGISLILDLPEEPVSIVGDRTRLAQVFGNLMDNARKFTPQGGRLEIRMAVDRASRRTLLTFRDSGIGIDPEMMSRLFEPFSQADQSLDRSRGGLGLGLALVKGLIELHGGTVSVHSEGLGKGAELNLSLPLGMQTPDRTDAPMDSEASSRKACVLVIEDIPDAAETLRDLVEIFGYEVELAFSGPEGLQKAMELRPAAVLCDIGLPELDGYSVATELRQNPATALIPIIAVTGYGKEEDRQRTRDLGFRAHLTKPIHPQELRKILNQVTQAKG